MEALLLYSNNAGKNKAIKLHDKIVKKLSSKFEITSKECPSLIDFNNEIKNSKDYECLFILGGDGTLNNAINVVASLPKVDRPTIGYIPTGTLNDAGKTFGIRGISKAIKIVLEGHKEDIDICSFNDKYFLYLAAIGQYSDISYSAKRDDKKKVGKMSYYKLAVTEAFQRYNINVSVEYDENIEEYQTPFIIVMNGKYVGGFKINPKNSISDGMMDVYITKPGMFNGLVHYFPFKTKTKHIRTNKIVITPKGDDPWCLDGEKVSSGIGKIKVLPSHISMFVRKR